MKMGLIQCTYCKKVTALATQTPIPQCVCGGSMSYKICDLSDLTSNNFSQVVVEELTKQIADRDVEIEKLTSDVKFWMDRNNETIRDIKKAIGE